LETSTSTPTAERRFRDELTREERISLRERYLLLLAGAFLLAIYTSLILVRGGTPFEYWHLAVWAGCALAGHVALDRRLPRRDPLIFPVVMLLSGWGLTLIDRLAPPFANRQSVWLMLSVAVVVGLTLMPGHLRWLSRYRYLWLVSGLVLLALTIVLGRNPSGGGPRLWLGVPDVFFQPSELLKVLLVVFLASYLADHQVLLDLHPTRIGPFRLPSLSFLGPLLVMWGLSGVVLVWQQDLGAATLFFVVFVTMLYVGSGQAIYAIGGAGLVLAASLLAYASFAVVRVRFDVWINPWPASDSSAFQVVQSLLAFSAGGVFGKTRAISPYPGSSDFVFATRGMGPLQHASGNGSSSWCGGRDQLHSCRHGSVFPARAYITLATQSLVIMGVLKLVPLTGVTLPFVSYGGSSLLMNFVMIGLLLVLSGD
jgi:peptidoglycan glycosyltransferase